LKLITETERYLQIPELKAIGAAIGFAELILLQKMEKLTGLCNKNIV